MTRAIATLFCVSAILAGCSDEPPAATGAGGSGGGTSVSTGGTGGGSGGGCMDGEASPNSVCITSVEGRFVDEQDQGVLVPLVSVCGPIQCNPGEGETDGSWVVPVGYQILPADYAAQAHARELGKATFYYRLPSDAPGPTVDMGDLRLLQMPNDGPSLIVDTDMMGAPAQSVTNHGVTLDIDAGVAVNLGFDDAFLGEEGKKFQALKVPDRFHAAYIDPSLNAAMLYAFYPFESGFRLESDTSQYTEVRLTFPNDPGWAPGTPVEFLALGTYIFPEWLTPATFEVVATGIVSNDGMTIETTPGEGFRHLTWVAVRETL
jgi:hypothetical protein